MMINDDEEINVFLVSFIPLDDCLNVEPPLKKGERDKVWVNVRSKKQKDIEKAARHKIRACYDIEIDDIKVEKNDE